MSVYMCNCGKQFADYNERIACLASHTTCTRCGQPMVAGENNNYGMHHVEKCCSILVLKLNDALKEIEQWRKHAEERADTHELEVRNLRAENEALRTRNDLLANRAYPPERDWGL